MRKSLISVIAGLMAAGCIYPYDIPIDSSQEKVLVIEGQVILGSTSAVRLRYMETLDGKSQGVPSGTVWLEKEDGSRYDAVDLGSGNFTLDTRLLPKDSRYRLVVKSHEKTYNTDWIAAPAPPKLDKLDFVADNNRVRVRLSLTAGESGYASVTFQEIWYFHADYHKELAYTWQTNKVSVLMNVDDTYYYCWKKNMASGETILDYTPMNGNVKNWEFWDFSRTHNRNHGDYTIKVQVRNLTEEEYRYRKLLENNTTQGSNLFTPEPGEVASNVRCESDPSVRVLGYVNVSQVATLSAHLDGSYFKHMNPGKLIVLEEDMYSQYYKDGYQPVVMIETDDGWAPGWGEERCYNCVAAGGTLEKPAFDL